MQPRFMEGSSGESPEKGAFLLAAPKLPTQRCCRGKLSMLSGAFWFFPFLSTDRFSFERGPSRLNPSMTSIHSSFLLFLGVRAWAPHCQVGNRIQPRRDVARYWSVVTAFLDLNWILKSSCQKSSCRMPGWGSWVGLGRCACSLHRAHPSNWLCLNVKQQTPSLAARLPKAMSTVPQ